MIFQRKKEMIGMAFLDKLKAGLAKTKNALFGQIDEVLKAFVKVDEDLLDELEELLPVLFLRMLSAEAMPAVTPAGSTRKTSTVWSKR